MGRGKSPPPLFMGQLVQAATYGTVYIPNVKINKAVRFNFAEKLCEFQTFSSWFSHPASEIILKYSQSCGKQVEVGNASIQLLPCCSK